MSKRKPEEQKSTFSRLNGVPFSLLEKRSRHIPRSGTWLDNGFALHVSGDMENGIFWYPEHGKRAFLKMARAAKREMNQYFNISILWGSEREKAGKIKAEKPLWGSWA